MEEREKTEGERAWRILVIALKSFSRLDWWVRKQRIIAEQKKKKVPRREKRFL